MFLLPSAGDYPPTTTHALCWRNSRDRMGDPALRLTLAQADVDSMSLRDLKQLITMAGLTLDGCLERPDLRQRAREAQAALAAGAAEAAAHTGPVDAGAVEALCAVLRERFGDEALRSAGFTHFGIAETVTVLARTIAASPDEHGVPLGKVPKHVAIVVSTRRQYATTM